MYPNKIGGRWTVVFNDLLSFFNIDLFDILSLILADKSIKEANISGDLACKINKMDKREKVVENTQDLGKKH